MDLLRANIFKIGSHPGQNAKGLLFNESDLDGIVSAFEQLQQAGRVPLKFGHDDSQPLTDGKPALGWVKRIWREAGNLYADFTDMPTVVFGMVKKALYKFCSIELLKDASIGDKSYPYVLDAVALLGAEPPAVSGLEDLQRLTLSRDSFKFATALSFKQAFDSIKHGDSMTMDPEEIRKAVAAALAPMQTQINELGVKLKATETESATFKADLTKVTAENAALKKEKEDAAKLAAAEKVKLAREGVTMILEAAVRAKKIMPAQRLSFSKLLRIEDDAAVVLIDTKTVEDLVGVKAEDAKKIMMGRSATIRDPADATGTDDDGTGNVIDFAEKHAEKLMKFARENGFGSDTFAAWPVYMRQHPTEGKAMTSFCFEAVTQ